MCPIVLHVSVIFTKQLIGDHRESKNGVLQYFNTFPSLYRTYVWLVGAVFHIDIDTIKTRSSPSMLLFTVYILCCIAFFTISHTPNLHFHILYFEDGVEKIRLLSI